MSDKAYKISKESVDKVFPQRTIQHIPLYLDDVIDTHGSVAFLHKKIMAQVVDITDRAIYEAIRKYAYEQGVTDIYLIDEEFIKSAIIHEVERRKEGTE